MKEIPNQDYTDDLEKVNELSIQTKGGLQTAHMKHKPSVFGDDVQVSLCGDNGCQEDLIDEGFKEEMMKCTFEGTFDLDPESKITYTSCSEGNTNLNLMSSKVELSSNTYRKVGDELKESETNLIFDDIMLPHTVPEHSGGVLSHDQYEETEYGIDYADDVSEECCRTTKKICTYKKEVLQKCDIKPQPIVCDTKKCSEMSKKYRHISTSVIGKNVKNNKKEKRQDKNKKTPPKKHKENTQKKRKKNKQKYKEEQKKLQNNEKVNQEKEKNLDLKDGNLKDMSEIELQNILKETENNFKKNKENDLRSTTLNLISNKKKKDNPKEKIYHQRTIELGIVIDKYLWQEMQNQMPDADEETVKRQMMKMVHSAIVSTETFMMHPSISKHGGYRLLIRGLRILKGDLDDFSKKIHHEKDHEQFLRHFAKYAEETNGDYDGDSNSYDINVLLSGAKENLGIAEYNEKGMATVAKACYIDAAMYTTVGISEMNHRDNLGALIAHEMGHVLGASHDGFGNELNSNHPNYPEGNTCEQNKFIMTPSQRGVITEWSSCSRFSIDFEYDRREKEMPNNGNCYYT